MFVKGIGVLVIILFINYSQTVQPQKNDISKAKISQGNKIAKDIPQTNQWNNIKNNKPQTKLKQPVTTQKKTLVPKSKLNQGNKISKNKPQIKRNNLPENKPHPNLQQKDNLPIKIPIKNQVNNIPKNIQTKQKNILPKNKPQKNALSNIPNNLHTKQKYIVPLNKPQTNEPNYIPKNLQTRQKNIVPYDNELNNILNNNVQTNQWNKIPKNIPWTKPENNVSKDLAPSKLNQENDMTNISQTNERSKITNNTPKLNKDGVEKKKWKFQDYLTKFEPKTIWEQIDKQRKYNGRQISDEEQMEIIIRGIDPTDEIMKLKIEDGDAKIIVPDARRGWQPNPGLHWYENDRFNLRRRLYELMKQAIYQTRNKMITMQEYREKYKKHAAYKMGFLMNKAENAAKVFGKFSFRAFRNCLLRREAVDRQPMFDLLSTNERQLNLWFNVEIIVDLINKNDVICKEIFLHHRGGRQELFDAQFVD